jgi:hypothetical protein
MSKSPSQDLLRLGGKLKLTEQENNYIFLSFIYSFQYYSVLVVSRFQWLV